MKIEQNMILDFSHIYPEDVEKQAPGLKRIDLSDIPGTDMYCTREAEEEIRRRLSPYGPRGIHFLDNGNYHYVTKFFAGKIREPFSLVLYDHHSDMQKPLFPGMTSCGSWAGELLLHHPYLRQMILAGPEQKSMEELPEELEEVLTEPGERPGKIRKQPGEPGKQAREKLVCISREEIENKAMDGKISRIDMTVPVYISIDKDVLDRSGARTNWDQGEMPLAVLEKLLLEVFVHQQVIGVDICGECSLLEPLQELMEDERINRLTNERLHHFLTRLFREFAA